MNSNEEFKKITTNTDDIKKGCRVFFCFSNAEKYLTNGIFDNLPKGLCVFSTEGLKERLTEKGVYYDEEKIKIYDNYKNDEELKRYLVQYLQNEYSLCKELKLVAITGSKGKTTTAWFTAQISSVNCGYIGTAGVFFFKKDKENSNQCPPEKIVNTCKVKLTTPAIDDLYYYIYLLEQKGAEIVVFEASAHALQQGRMEGLNISCACFTNFSQDHLDYFKTMENYFESKLLLFLKYLSAGGTAIINGDVYNNYNKEKIAKACRGKNVVMFYEEGNNDSLEIENIKIEKVSKIKDGFGCKVDVCYTCYSSGFVAEKKDINFSFKKIFGKFNINNAVMAMEICIKLGICEQFLKNSQSSLYTSNITTPPGRCEIIPCTTDSDNNKFIVVDFAHTPKSLEEMLVSLRDVFDYIVVVFGCGGCRDRLKRPIMLEVAKYLADFVIITSDNSRSEPIEQIIYDIFNRYDSFKFWNKRISHEFEDYSSLFHYERDYNVDANFWNDEKNKNFVSEQLKQLKGKYGEIKKNNNIALFLNRETAISYAIDKIYDEKNNNTENKKKYCVLLAGKGDEEFQIVFDEIHEFNDKKVANKILLERRFTKK